MEVTRVFQVKIGMRHMVMPGARMRDDRGDEVDGAEDGAETGERRGRSTQRLPPTPGVNVVLRQRRVGEPAERRGTLRGEEAGDGDRGAEEEEPERERVQSRERDVGRTDLQRHDDVREAGEQRRREHQQHDRAVHREELVVLLFGLQDLHAGLEQLGADEQRHHAAEAEEDERRDQVQVPDRLVVGGGDPVDDDASLATSVLTGASRIAGAIECKLPRRSPYLVSAAGRVAVVLFTELAGVPVLAQLVHVRLVLRLGDDLHAEQHFGVVLAAELGALAVVGALPGGRQPDVVGLAGNHVPLVQEVRDPERVDDVARVELELDRLVDRQVQGGQLVLVHVVTGQVRLDAGFVHVLGDDVALQVVEVPRPLLAADVDDDVGRR